MSLKQQLQEDMKTALRNHDSATLSTIRMALAAIKQIEVDERIEVDDTRFTAIISKMVKQRKESVRMYTEAGRTDLAEKEQSEIDLLQNYLPKMLDEAEIDVAIKEAITNTGAAQPSDMGKVMGVLKKTLAGKADMSEVSKKIKQLLN
ncbi:glutamyl-tRNA amidotransferase [Snodgrassella alvi]|uniref:Glutamyl-tRNA amidotransferase n=1 Tax=Snodgrassella alvi TaxID=1196083 RepID=A0A2N9Y5V1_9NEIS|nr:GatB/YqeY domain-containing protein [Snodgrassella alvi]OOX79514.1 glutamyl-tRNA amidotransferase [Snodgrassella alvi]ORF02004.1 glutamyl-tRNA amidotransferase [Snodgrassella alvi]PIT63976.1 glutamyl-tRNA amidotransferase [Snodgrassella alvi]PIT66822.1 glutamyl-tRNA amidotransferase [Snodgrassella alvi]